MVGQLLQNEAFDGKKGSTDKSIIQACCRLLVDQKAMDVVLLDISQRASFADWFVIATVTSLGHLRGLTKNVDEFLAPHEIHARGSKRTVQDDDNWILLDCGDFVVHLMTKEGREFFDLEKLWFDSPVCDYLT